MAYAPAITLSHVVLHCFDLDRMIDFYKRVLGLHETDRITMGGGAFNGAPLVFFSSDPRDHHQFALSIGRTAERDAVLLHQVSFRHDSLARLRRLRDALEQDGVEEIRPVDHGTHWSIYFDDPEGNMIEAFVDTPWYVQPHYHSLDLSLSDDEIAQATEARIKDRPGFKPLDEWRKDLARELEKELETASA
jgi:catechol 2,3-dioxygenase